MLTMLVLLGLVAIPQDRLPVPADGDLREARKKARAALSDPERLVTAAGQEEDRFLKYALYERAWILSAEDLDLASAIHAIESASRAFSLDAFETTDTMLAVARKRIRKPEDLERFMKGAFAAADGPAAVALAVLEEAEKLAKKARRKELAEEAGILAAAASRRLSAHRAAMVLTEEEDPRARTALGVFLCFDAGAWEEGLPHLAKGADKPLADLAAAELAGKAPGMLGAQWAVAAKKMKGPERSWFVHRAVHWYRKALAAAPELQKKEWTARIEKALADRTGLVDLLPLVDLEKSRGKWKRIRSGVECEAFDKTWIRVAYQPPLEYDIELVVERVSGNRFLTLSAFGGGKRCKIGFDSSASTTGVNGAPETARKGWVLHEKTPRKIMVSVRKNSLSVTVAGSAVIDWKADWNKVAGEAQDPNAIFLETFSTAWRIRQFSLRPVSGSGRVLD